MWYGGVCLCRSELVMTIIIRTRGVHYFETTFLVSRHLCSSSLSLAESNITDTASPELVYTHVRITVLTFEYSRALLRRPRGTLEVHAHA